MSNLKDLMTSVRSLSCELESGLSKQNNWNALSAFEELAQLTQQALAPAPSTPTAAEPQSAAALKPAPAPPAAPPPRIVGHTTAGSSPGARYATRKTEYAPALNQNDLVQALLRYQQQRGSRSRITQTKTPAQGRVPNGPSPQGVPLGTEFSPMQVPLVSAEPKETRIGSSNRQGNSLGNALGRSSGIRIPILRSKPENRNGGD